MGSYISNIDRCTEPCSGTVKTSINIIEDTMVDADRFVNQLMEICNMHYDLNTMTIERSERSRRIFAREDKKVDFNLILRKLSLITQLLLCCGKMVQKQ